MIDFHCLRHPNKDRSKYLDKLEYEFSKSPYNFRVLDGIAGRLGEAREQGYMLGDCEYVAYIDDDDEILIHGFESVLEKLNSDKSIAAVASREYINCNGTINKTFYTVHDGDTIKAFDIPQAHRLVVRRDVMNKIIGKFTHTNICDFIVRVQIFLNGGKVVHDDSFTQVYNVDESSVACKNYTHTAYEKQIMADFIELLKSEN